MKTILTIIFLASLVFYGLGARIEFKPYRIHFDSWVWFVGFLITLIGVSIIYYAGYRDGLRYGREATFQTLLKIANDEIQDNAKNPI